MLGDQFRPVLPLVRLAHFLDALQRLGGREVFLVKALALLDDLPHAPFELREIRLGQRLAQEEVVVEAVLDGRTETQGGAGTQLQHRLRKHMRQAVANSVQLIVRLLRAAVFGTLPGALVQGSHYAPLLDECGKFSAPSGTPPPQAGKVRMIATG